MLYSDYEERIDSIQGNYIVSGDRIFENLTSKVDLVLSPGVIRIGDKTTLWGWFYTPCEYIGMLENRAIFYLAGQVTCSTNRHIITMLRIYSGRIVSAKHTGRGHLGIAYGKIINGNSGHYKSNQSSSATLTAFFVLKHQVAKLVFRQVYL